MKGKTDFFARAKSTGSGLLQQEGSLAAMMLSKGTETKLPVTYIKARRNPSTRKLDGGHVLELAASIAALGQIESLAVDTNHHLLAGGHRLCALQLLAEHAEDRADLWKTTFGEKPDEKTLKHLTRLPVFTGLVSVNILPMDSGSDTAKALAIEIAENERRRNFSREEIRGLADRLRAAGYRTTKGRAKEGEIALIPALSAVLGKGRATVFRMLRENGSGTKAEQKSRSVQPGVEDTKILHAMHRWLDRSPDSPCRVLVEKLVLEMTPTKA
jgi:ParB family chromosome partitioning protein